MEMNQMTVNDISDLLIKFSKEKDNITNLYKTAIANIEDIEIDISSEEEYNYIEKRKEITEKYSNLKSEKNLVQKKEEELTEIEKEEISKILFEESK